MQSSSDPPSPSHVRGWILDVYPSDFGKFAVWVIAENGQRIRLTDTFHPVVYVAGKEESLDRLASGFVYDNAVLSWDFVQRYARATDIKESTVLQVTLKDSRMSGGFTQRVLKAGKYLQYQVFNCDLKHEQMYFYTKDLFALAFVEIEASGDCLHYTLEDSADSVDYSVPPLRILKVDVEVAKAGKIARLSDPIGRITVTKDDDAVIIDAGDEAQKILNFVSVVKQLDPDIIVTKGGDSYLFPYLARRAVINNVSEKLVLGRDDAPLVAKNIRGRTFFSYGRTFYRAPARRLYGRVHVDAKNTFVLAECDLDGLFEIGRTCRVSLHTAARSSIGSSMSSIEFYEAFKSGLLIPRNKSIPEAFKSALELLVGDRGGFVYEPEVGVHDDVGEVDFSSMYPTVMVNNNISAETVLCKCCPDSKIRIPELGYHICEKREGVVPKALRPVIAKRLKYKRLKADATDENLKEVYDNRQAALKWISCDMFWLLRL